MTPCNTDERTPIPKLLQQLFGEVFADKDYVSQKLLKWAITINGLKNFSTNRRVIERIIGERTEDASLFGLIL